MKKLIACAVFLVACGDNGVKPDAFVRPPDDAIGDDSGPGDGSNNNNQPQSIDLAGHASGIFLDNASHTVFLTDNDAGSVLKYTDANGIQTVGTFDSAAVPLNGFSFGGILRESDGSVITTNFGNNTEGAIFALPGGTSTGEKLTGPLVARKRTGLAQDSAGTIYEVFVTGGGTPVGSLATVTVDVGGGSATETTVATMGNGLALKKVIGVATTTGKVFVSNQIDATHAEILSYDPTDFTTSTQVVATDVVDLISTLPNGDVLVGGGATLRRVDVANTAIADVTLSGVTFEQVGGTVFDEHGGRLFVIDRSQSGGADKLHIIPFVP